MKYDREFWVAHCHLSGQELSRKYGRDGGAWRKNIRTAKLRFPDLPWYTHSLGTAPAAAPSSEPAYKDCVEILADGTTRSDRLVTMTLEQSKDPAFLLAAHGFDVDAWELVTAKSNIWNVYSKGECGHDVSTLYSSKITVRPLTAAWCVDDLLAALSASQVPTHIDQPTYGDRCLEVSLTDMHLGNSTMDWYRDNLARIVEEITAREWREVVIWLGSDFFHTDNFKNTTSNGTPQSSMWWPDAYRDGMEFVGTVIQAALAHAVTVYAYYVPGNHDESMAWAFTQTVQVCYPQVCFDTTIQERKVHIFEDCAIGMTHGDEKTRKDLDRVFTAEFPEFAASAHREVHMGHLHHEKSIDQFGVTTRSLPSGARTDKWHRETGFVGARKVFQMFEWEAGFGPRKVHYV